MDFEKTKEIFTTNSYGETLDLGIMLTETKKIQFGDIIALCGDLGAGKTALTKGIAQGLGVCEIVTSPTFSIVNGYVVPESPLFVTEKRKKKYLYHFDMYRIETEDDLYSIDLYDYISEDNIIIMEWFENIESFFDDSYKVKKFFLEKLPEDENKRKFILRF